MRNFSIRTLLLAFVLIALALMGYRSWYAWSRSQQAQIRLVDERGALEGRVIRINQRSVRHLPASLTAEEFFDYDQPRVAHPGFGEVHFSPLGMFVENSGAANSEAAFVFVQADGNDRYSVNTPFGRAALVQWTLMGLRFGKGKSPALQVWQPTRRVVDALRLEPDPKNAGKILVKVQCSPLTAKGEFQRCRFQWGRFDKFTPIRRSVFNTTSKSTVELIQIGEVGPLEDGVYWCAVDLVQFRESTEEVDCVPKCFSVSSISGTPIMTVLE